MQKQHRIFQPESKTDYRKQLEQASELWTLIPEHPTGHAIETCLSNLIRQITMKHRERKVTHLKINKDLRTLEIHFEKGENADE